MTSDGPLIKTNPQAAIDRIFKLFVDGELDRFGYVNTLNGAWDRMETEHKKKIRSRIDVRSFGHAGLHFYDSTRREKFLVEGMRACAFEDIEIRFTDNGISNDGRLILDTMGLNGNADFYAESSAGKGYVEVKPCPRLFMATFKRLDLLNYIKSGVYVLTIQTDGDVGPSNGNPASRCKYIFPGRVQWFMMGRAQMEAVLATGQHGAHPGFGGKPTVRIYNKDFDRYDITIREWTRP